MLAADYSVVASTVEDAFADGISNINPADREIVQEAVNTTLNWLDTGQIRVAARVDGTADSPWIVHQWTRKAILLFFQLQGLKLIGNIDFGIWWDKVPSKFNGWTEVDFTRAGFRVVPGCVVRYSAYIAPGVVLLPSFINLGAYVDTGTMIDSWVSVGSCAQIGRNVHISAGATIGGVLEPANAVPTIVEDDCFIGANSAIIEGVVVCEGAVIAAGVTIGASTKIVDRSTGEIVLGSVPPYSVVVPGACSLETIINRQGMLSVSCAVIVKRVDKKTRLRTSINDLLR